MSEWGRVSQWVSESLSESESQWVSEWVRTTHYYRFYMFMTCVLDVYYMFRLEKKCLPFHFLSLSSSFCPSFPPPAGTNRWLLLRPGHQPAARRFPAGHRSHSVHWEPWPHDLCDLLCLQRLLRRLRRHQEWTSQEGRRSLTLVGQGGPLLKWSCGSGPSHRGHGESLLLNVH